jgi:protein-S-isoprenylcysteine O-methyltransferase Ste14
VPEAVFRIALPLLWLALDAALAANRWQLRRRLGRDPIVARPGRKAETPAGYLEIVLSACALLATLDIALNALAPGTVADNLAFKTLRASRTAGLLGLALIASGCALAISAVRQMSVSWRIGIDRLAPGPLVSRGLYARMRHPIYTGMLLATTGLAGLTADALSVAVATAAWVGLPVQARLEEAFLLSRHPEEYPEYLARTGRFLPRIRTRTRESERSSS